MSYYKEGDKIRARRDGEQHCIKFGAVCTILRDQREADDLIPVSGPSKNGGMTRQFLYIDQMKPAKQSK